MGHFIFELDERMSCSMEPPSSYTVLFDLKIKQSVYENSIFDKTTQVLASKIGDYFKILYQDETHYVGGFDKTQSTCTVKVFEGTGCKNVTVTMEIPRLAFQRFNTRMDEFFEETIAVELKKEVPGCMKVNFLPAIRRNLKDSPYLRSADNRILEYNFDEVLFSKPSDHQSIQIVATKDFGRLLILNDMANLAENDKVEYTHTLMNLPNENYGGKEVLILGGGDGGLLKELLELPKGQVPAFITMVEIDEMVMTACSEYMPSVCGKYTRKENWEGPNYKVINGCAIQFMKDCQAKGKSFDYIFGDLTDTPITTKKPCEDCWIFLSTILELGMSVLKPLTGKYLTHCNGVNVPQSITAYENVLAKICGGKVFFSKTKCYVKSFFETWVFYQLSRRD